MNRGDEGEAVTALLGMIQPLIDCGPDARGTGQILSLLGCPVQPEALLTGMRLYSEYLPKAAEYPFSTGQRNLHFLWDAFDRSPSSLSVNIAFPFRRMIARKLFRRCGKNFNAEGDVRFNFGQFLSVGDDVFFNQGSYLDTKGGITIGHAVGIGEFVRIFTHSHGEADHTLRTYSPVAIGDYAKIFTGAMILPGVTIGREAIVAGGSVVTRDVPPGTVVAGIPARVLRDRKTEGKQGKGLNHTWLYQGAFQEE
jgi:acetyltransferase-like isoleucine patch superfamily enzyme